MIWGQWSMAELNNNVFKLWSRVCEIKAWAGINRQQRVSLKERSITCRHAKTPKHTTLQPNTERRAFSFLHCALIKPPCCQREANPFRSSGSKLSVGTVDTAQCYTSITCHLQRQQVKGAGPRPRLHSYGATTWSELICGDCCAVSCNLPPNCRIMRITSQKYFSSFVPSLSLFSRRFEKTFKRLSQRPAVSLFLLCDKTHLILIFYCTYITLLHWTWSILSDILMSACKEKKTQALFASSTPHCLGADTVSNIYFTERLLACEDFAEVSNDWLFLSNHHLFV